MTSHLKVSHHALVRYLERSGELDIGAIKDHALIEYIERYGLADLDAISEEMQPTGRLADAVEIMGKKRAMMRFSLPGGLRAVVTNNVIVTVVPK